MTIEMTVKATIAERHATETAKTKGTLTTDPKPNKIIANITIGFTILRTFRILIF